MQRSLVSGFDWDVGNRDKCQKHGVTLGEIEAVFSHPHYLAPDLGHSDQETRYLAIGRGGALRPVFVAFTLREKDGATYIRPVSARYMHRKEIEHHEQAIASSDQR